MITNKLELRQAIAGELSRTDLNGSIDTWIQLCEARFDRQVSYRLQKAEVTLTPNANGSYTLPADYLAVISAIYPTNKVPLLSTTLTALQAEYQNQTGTPEKYAVVGNEIVVSPPAKTPDNLTLTYKARLDPLDVDGATNWLLDAHPDIYFYGSLIHSAPYLMDDQRTGVWSDFYNTAVSELRKDDARSRFNSAPSAPVTDTSRP